MPPFDFDSVRVYTISANRYAFYYYKNNQQVCVEFRDRL